MNITTIIPIHELNEEEGKLLKEALTSVSGQSKFDIKNVEVLLVHPKEVEEQIKKSIKGVEGLNIKHVINDTDDTGFQNQINVGVENSESAYFTILEFDDELSETYYYNVYQHIAYLANTSLFLPMIVETNDENKVVKLTNETVWSRSFVGENGTLGYLNSNSLEQYTDFKISGSIFKKDDYINAGMLKTNIELSFQYELLLRMLNSGYTIYTIPKILCKHYTTREGSLFVRYGKNLTMKEKKFWYETAKSESNFPTDREIDKSELLKVVE